MKSKTFWGAVALGFGLVASAVVVQAQATKQLSIATGGTGGVYYPMGGGLASIIGKKMTGFTATAEVTGGSVANLQALGAGKSDIGFSQVDAAFDAISGVDKFSRGKLDIKALAVLYPNIMHVVTIEGTNINKVEDMKGRRVSTGSPGSATEVFALRVIEAAGLDPQKDLTRERLGAAESVNAIKDCCSHRSCRHTWREDQNDRQRRERRQDDCQVRQYLCRSQCAKVSLQRHGSRQRDDSCLEHPRSQWHHD
jgi:uncharacterized protein